MKKTKYFFIVLILTITITLVFRTQMNNKSSKTNSDSQQNTSLENISVPSNFSSTVDNYLLKSANLIIYKNTGTNSAYGEIKSQDTFKFLTIADEKFFCKNDSCYKNLSNYSVNFSHTKIIGNIFSIINNNPELLQISDTTCLKDSQKTCKQYSYPNRFELLVNTTNSTIEKLVYLSEEFETSFDQIDFTIEKPATYEEITDSTEAELVFTEPCNEIKAINQYYLCEKSSINIY
jgi:hypothetical protein